MAELLNFILIKILLPVLCTVRFHEVLVRVEEDPPVLVDAGHPDGQDGSLQSGPEVGLQGLFLRLSPDEEPDVVTTGHPDLPVLELEVCGVLIVRGHDPVVEVRGGGAGEHHVGEADGDLVLGVDERHVRLVLHVPLELVPALGEDDAVEETGQTPGLLLHELNIFIMDRGQCELSLTK